MQVSAKFIALAARGAGVIERRMISAFMAQGF